jgi:hypothetical protein
MLEYALIICVIVLLISFCNERLTSEPIDLHPANLDRPKALAPYLGYWIWQSDDALRKEIISIDYGGDNRFLRLTRTYKFKKWYPPVTPGEPGWIAPVENWTENPPLLRVIILSKNEIYCKYVEPTYAGLPFRIKLLDDGTHIEILGKKYISSNKLPIGITFRD